MRTICHRAFRFARWAIALPVLVGALAIASPTAAEPLEGSAEAMAPGSQVAYLAGEYAGAPYVWGGASPRGFDCTGFVQWVYGQFGVALPRTEAGQLASGPRVDPDGLEPGDVLVFANTYRAGLSHVGIYLGEGQFIHAVDERHGVRVSQLWDGYWAPRFVGASRPAVA